jgi:hypothetical protein
MINKKQHVLRYALFVLLSFLYLGTHAQTQVCQPNMDFGLGNFNNWKYYEGTYIGNGNNAGVTVDTMQVYPPSTATYKRFTVTSGTTTDYYGGFPIADPLRTYSLKIGFDSNNYCVNKARFQVHVPAGTNDYALIYRYAIVMEDPGHIPSQQPKFLVKSTDSLTGTPLACGNFTYVAGSLPGFSLSSQGTNVYYKAWATASLNLSGYAGKTVTVEFEAFDCALSGHWGYGYVDMTCGLFEIVVNKCSLGGNTTLSAPPGFQTYSWYDSTYTTLLASTDTFTFATPNVSKSYHVICSPYSGYGCPDTLHSRINISNLSTHASNDTTICSGSTITLTTNTTGGIPPFTYSWNPVYDLSCTNCQTTNASPTTSAAYVITVNDSTGCGRTDTVNVTVNHIANVTTNPGTVTSCSNTSVSFNAAATGTPTPTVQWQLSSNGTSWSNITGANANTYTFTCNASLNGYQYRAIYNNTCGSDTSTAATLNVNTQPAVNTNPTANVTACNGSTVNMVAAAGGNPTPTIQWQQSTNGGSTWTNISGATSNTYSFSCSTTQSGYKYRAVYSNTCGNDTSGISTLTVNPNLTPTATISVSSLSICAGTPDTFSVVATNGGNGPAYQWQLNNTNVGTNSTTYINNSLTSTDVVKCIVTSNATCLATNTATSNTKSVTVNPVLTPSVSIAANPGTSIYVGTSVTFTATATNGGNTPVYQWKKNGTIVGTNSNTYTNSNWSANDTISCTITSNATCASPLTANNYVVITLLNRPPVANPDFYSTNGNTGVSGDVSTNDSDPDNNLNPNSYTTTCSNCYTPSHGSLTLNANGTFTYLPNNGFTGTDKFVYQVCDNGTPSLCDTALVTITVINRPPVALTDNFSTTGNTPVNGNVSLNDSDPDGNLNTTSYTTGCSNCSSPVNGTLTFHNDGTFTYSPNSGFTGMDHFAYQVCDNGSPSLCDTAIVNLSVINRAPVAVWDTATTNGNNSANGNVSLNDYDPDGNLNIHSYTTSCSTCTTPTNGSLTFNSNGSYIYTPNSGFTGTDIFIYQVCDNGTPSLCDTAIVKISVVNNPPVANPDYYTTNGNTAISGNVGSNDTDPDGNLNSNSFTTACANCSTPAHGSLTLNSNGSFTYTPNNNFSGTDYFVYQVCDLGTPSLCDTALVTITVNPIPSVSISGAPSGPICYGSSVTFTASPINGGSNPAYQWKKNGTNVGTNSATYTDNTLTNGNTITCTLTSNAPGAFPSTVTSNTLTVSVNPVASQPSSFITSAAIVYDGQIGVNYSVTNDTSVSYTWSYSGTGATLSGSGNSINIDFGTSATSGNLCVTATNHLGCGASAPRCIAITVKPYLTWTCTACNDWNNAANWDGGFVPYGTISVLIPVNTTCSPSVCTGNGNVYNMIVNKGAIVNVCCGNNLFVNNALTLNGSVTGCGYLTVKGSSCNPIIGNGRVDNFELNNSCGGIINSGDTLHIGKTYKPTLGVMNVNGELELLSDSIATAVIVAHPGTCATNYIVGDVICDKWVHGGQRAFRFLGHPFTSSIGLDQLTPYIDITGNGGSANGFTTNATNNPSAFWYNTLTGNGSCVNDSTGWIPFTNTNGSALNAWNRFEGIRVLFRGSKGQGLGCNLCVPDAITYKLHGQINECDETVTLNTNANVGYNFISNPYPSNIDLSTLTKGSNVGHNFAVWDPNQGVYGAYVSQPFCFSYILPSLSAFFTTSSANNNNTITFTESCKTGNAPTGSLFKTTSGFGNEVVQLRILSNNDSLSWDRLLLFFNAQASDATDSLDAQKIYNPGLSFFTIATDANQLSVDERPFINNQVIPLGLQYADANNYSIRVDDYNIPAGSVIYLHDKYLNQTQALSLGMHYNFSVTGDSASQGNNRFELNIANSSTAVNNINSDEFDVKMMPNPASGNVVIKLHAAQSGNTSIKITNLLGQTVYFNNMGNVSNTSVNIPLNNLSEGLYILTVQCGDHLATERLIKQ